MSMHKFHLYLISDATGETLGNVARACLVQFETVEGVEHLWPMVRTKRQLEKVLSAIDARPLRRIGCKVASTARSGE